MTMFFKNLFRPNKINKIIDELKEQRNAVNEFINNYDPYNYYYCTRQHTKCNSEGLLAWEKDADLKIVKANKKANEFAHRFSHSTKAKGSILNKTNTEVFDWKNDEQNTFGQISHLTDLYVMDSKKPGRFFEFGYKENDMFLLDVYKIPLFDNEIFTGLSCTGIDITKKQTDILDLVVFYLRVGIATRIDSGISKDLAVYLIEERRKKQRK